MIKKLYIVVRDCETVFGKHFKRVDEQTRSVGRRHSTVCISDLSGFRVFEKERRR